MREHLLRGLENAVGLQQVERAHRLAHAVCRADPGAVVLVVCAELCSLHLHVGDDLDTILSSSLFADGAAAAGVVGATTSSASRTTRTRNTPIVRV